MATRSDKKGKAFGKKLLLLILSFAIALLLWYICMIQDEKMLSKQFDDIPVVYTSEEMLADKNLEAKAIKEQKISVVLKGPVSMIRDLDSKSLVAEIDVGSIRTPGDFLKVPTVTGLPENVTASADAITVEIERVITKYLPIDVEIIGTPAEGFRVTKENVVLLDTEMVGVSCGATMSKSVAAAKIVVDTTGRSSSYSVNLNIILLDTTGKEVDINKVRLERDSVNVSVTVVEE